MPTACANATRAQKIASRKDATARAMRVTLARPGILIAEQLLRFCRPAHIELRIQSERLRDELLSRRRLSRPEANGPRMKDKPRVLHAVRERAVDCHLRVRVAAI